MKPAVYQGGVYQTDRRWESTSDDEPADVIIIDNVPSQANRLSEKAAREAADGVSAEVRALAEKLATNDFPHVEARVNRGLQDMGERIDRVEARMGERFDRARQDRRDMEARILAAVQRRPAEYDNDGEWP